MKIVFLSLFSGQVNRGVETWTSELATRLSKKGHDVTVFQGANEKVTRNYKLEIIDLDINLNKRAGESTTSQIRFWIYWILINLSFCLKAIPRIVKIRPQVVLPTNGEVQTLIIKLCSLLFGWKMVVTSHAGLGAHEKWNLMMRPDVYVLPSARGLDWVEKIWYARGIKTIYIPHGVDLEKFRPGKSKITISLERPIILCVSSFDPFKRVDLAIAAVSKLKKGSLVVLGGERSEGKIEKIAEKLLGDKRFLLKKISPEAMPEYYKSADIFTLPSNESEAFGIANLEALASGLPVVATNDLLRKEIIGDAGILIDPTDSESYSNALQTAFETNWGDKPRKQAEKYSWDMVAKKYNDLFEELID